MVQKTFAFVVLAALLATPGSTRDDSASRIAPRAAPQAAVAITGRVTNAQTGAPIASAQVFIQSLGIGVLSQQNGRYILLNVPDGLIGQEVEVTAVRIGFAEVRGTIRVGEGTNTLDLAMTEEALRLDEVVVTGTVGQQQRRALADDTGSGRAEAARTLPQNARTPAVHFAPGAPPTDREQYAHIAENEFSSAHANPLSTFSIDVDRASYANVRRFIRDGMRPPVDAVRIEELVNYFTYDDSEPDGDVPFSITTEVAPAPWQPLHHLVRIGLRGRSVDMGEAPASNLVFLLDVSGSMNSPDKLPLLKRSFRMLTGELRPQDRVAIVVYAGAAGLVLPSTPGSDRAAILEAIDRLNAGGSTAGGAGIRLAYAVAAENHIEGGNNRVILATDGDFNVGASSDSEMIRLIEEKREQGTFLTVLGFGTGNLQDAKMEQIADHGNGNFAYIDSELEARKVLVHEMGGTLLTIAKDVKIQVEFNPARVAGYRLIGYENRLLAAEDFADDTKDAGEMGAGHSVTALYEVIPVGVESPVEVRDVGDLRYGSRNQAGDADGELLFVKVRYKEPTGAESRLVTHVVAEPTEETSDDFRFAAAVAAWGMLLRDSEHCAGFDLDDVARLARGSLGRDERGYRSDFLGLVDRARSMDLLASRPGGSAGRPRVR